MTMRQGRQSTEQYRSLIPTADLPLASLATGLAPRAMAPPSRNRTRSKAEDERVSLRLMGLPPIATAVRRFCLPDVGVWEGLGG